MKKRRIIRWTVLGVLLTAVIGFTVYKWPQHKDLTFENVALWYARDDADKVEGFQPGYTTVKLSLVRRRMLTAPDSYSGTIMVGDVEYTIQGERRNGLISDMQDKIAYGKTPAMTLHADYRVTKEIEPGLLIPRAESIVTDYIDKRFDRFYLLESPKVGVDFIKAYVYPAASDSEAYALYQSLND